MLLREGNILYHDSWMPMTSQRFSYRMVHLPSSTTVVRAVYVNSQTDGFRLLDIWNKKGRGVYLYTSEGTHDN